MSYVSFLCNHIICNVFSIEVNLLPLRFYVRYADSAKEGEVGFECVCGWLDWVLEYSFQLFALDFSMFPSERLEMDDAFLNVYLHLWHWTRRPMGLCQSCEPWIRHWHCEFGGCYKYSILIPLQCSKVTTFSFSHVWCMQKCVNRNLSVHNDLDVKFEVSIIVHLSWLKVVETVGGFCNQSSDNRGQCCITKSILTGIWDLLNDKT